MKKSLPVLLFFVVAGVASAATITIGDLPGTAVANLLTQCEELRKSLGRSPADWASGVDPQSNCAKEFLRIGSRHFTRETALRVRNADKEAFITADMATYDVDFPKPVTAFCGDGTIDNFDSFAEECDDGNNDNDDGCDATCNNE